jgi:hypothetical protein
MSSLDLAGITILLIVLALFAFVWIALETRPSLRKRQPP